MNALAFFRSEAVGRLLERAACCAGTPLALHFVDRDEEGARIIGWGSRRVCRHVGKYPGAKRACRQARANAAATAFRQGRPAVFICHMGFACVVAPALEGQQFALTFGPYCPAEESRSLEFDACNGLRRLTREDIETFPVPLDDIHRAPVAAVPAVAEWVVEMLAVLWEQMQEPLEEFAGPEDAAPDTGTTRKPKGPGHGGMGCGNAGGALGTDAGAHSTLSASYATEDIAAALVGGNQPHARASLRRMLEEMRAGRGRRITVRRAHMIAAVADVLGALDAAGVDTRNAWGAFHTLVDGVREARTDRGLLDAAMGLLGVVRREAARSVKGDQGQVSPDASSEREYLELNRVLHEWLEKDITREEGAAREEAITLEKVARQLGETPSAISHRLKRKFGMSYSKYVGRLRVDKAKELLLHTRLSVAEVGLRVGIRDQSNFSKTFKRFEGISPLEYRRRFGKKS